MGITIVSDKLGTSEVQKLQERTNGLERKGLSIRSIMYELGLKEHVSVKLSQNEQRQIIMNCCRN